MPELTRPDGAVIHYEVAGDGPALLALAPGDASSGIDQWANAVFDARRLSDCFRVITMDQRYAGKSRAPFEQFSWELATHDQIAVLDAVGAKEAHVVGVEIGATHALRLLDEGAARVASAVLIDPLGLENESSIQSYYAIFNDTIRTARAAGLEGVFAAAAQDGCFARNRAAGPWAQRLHDDATFRESVRALGRETYIAMVVDFRDGMFPWNERLVSIDRRSLDQVPAPVLVMTSREAKVNAADGTEANAIADEIVEVLPKGERGRIAAGASGERVAIEAEIRAFLARTR